MPAPADSVSKRLGDPGSAHEETAGWNTLVLFIVYTAPTEAGVTVIPKTLTQKEYNALQPISEGSSFKRYTLTAPAGKVYFYGLTYFNPTGADGSYPGAEELRTAIGRCATKADVEALTISNYYPYAVDSKSADVSKFCSVASGYYQENGGTPKPYTIDYSNIPTELSEIPTLTLRRLAAKIDVQWDAEGAYSGGKYTDARVEGFVFHSHEYGRVFPELDKSANTSDEKDWNFYNNTPISQRNGRVYHYTFPDGVTKPQVEFTIATATDGEELGEPKTYSLTWNDKLTRATWYKVNATVRGNSREEGEITISNWDNGTGN